MLKKCQNSRGCCPSLTGINIILTSRGCTCAVINEDCCTNIPPKLYDVFCWMNTSVKATKIFAEWINIILFSRTYGSLSGVWGKKPLSLDINNRHTILGIYFSPKTSDHFLFLLLGILLKCIQSYLIKISRWSKLWLKTEDQRTNCSSNPLWKPPDSIPEPYSTSL